MREEDAVMEYEGGFRLVCEPKSLLYLFGMEVRPSKEEFVLEPAQGLFVAGRSDCSRSSGVM